MKTKSKWCAAATASLYVTCAWMLSTSPASTAASYPERPVRFVLGFPPGGSSDGIARVVAPKLHELMGQPWVIDNRPGAAGNIATEIVAQANPDGHTVLLGFSTTLTVNPSLYKLSFDVKRDFRPVTLLAAGQYMLVTHPSVNASSVKGFIELAKRQRDPFNYASSGYGSPHQLAAELFKLRAGIDMVHVPYKGGGPAAAAVVGKEVQVLFASLTSILPHVNTGRVKALAVTGSNRAPVARDVPTVGESGFPGFEVTSWYGLVVPSRTSQNIIDKLHGAAGRVLQMRDIHTALTRLGLDVIGKGPNPFAAQIDSETKQWAAVIKRANIQVR